jgi:predicted nucleic acid-binding protein
MESRRRMRVLLDTKAEKFDLTIVSFDSNFDKTDLVRRHNLKYLK